MIKQKYILFNIPSLSVLNIIGVNSLRLGGLQLIIKIPNIFLHFVYYWVIKFSTLFFSFDFRNKNSYRALEMPLVRILTPGNKYVSRLRNFREFLIHNFIFISYKGHPLTHVLYIRCLMFNLSNCIKLYCLVIPVLSSSSF